MANSRFWLVAKHDFNTYRKTIVLSLAAILCTSVFFGALLGYYSKGGGIREVVCFGILYDFFAIVCASVMFADMKTKQGRIANLMVPATASDKFLVRWIAFVPILLGIFIASFYAAEIARVFFHNILFNPGFDTHVINPWETLVFHIGYLGNNFTGITIAFLLACYLFNQSIYIFGSILWPKLSFLKTTVALWVLQTVFGFFILGIDRFLPDEGEMHAVVTLFKGTAWTFYALAVALWGLTYLRYKRSNVIYKLF